MEPEYIKKIIDILKQNFVTDKNIEITLETNPGTVDKNKLVKLKALGINRISIGIQSFDNENLKFLTRIHNCENAIKTVEDSFNVGFDNISIDLIFNIPGQSKVGWIKNLEIAAALPINHISAYSLILERGTILNKMVLDKKVIIEGEEFDADLYETTIDFLSGGGFEQYEVSNYAKPGYQSIHNNFYWTHKEYLGFGCSAHSFVNSERWWNYSNITRYIESVKHKSVGVKNREMLNKNQLMDEYLMLHLRGNGLDLKQFKKKFGNEFWLQKISYIDSLVKNNYLIDENNTLRMTKAGYLLCDEILANLLSKISGKE